MNDICRNSHLYLEKKGKRENCTLNTEKWKLCNRIAIWCKESIIFDSSTLKSGGFGVLDASSGKFSDKEHFQPSGTTHSAEI